MTNIIIEQLGPIIATASTIRLVLDDSPTKRYGRKIEGAGFHHNPTQKKLAPRQKKHVPRQKKLASLREICPILANPSKSALSALFA